MKNNLFRVEALKNRESLWSAEAFIPRGIPLWIITLCVSMVIFLTVFLFVFYGYNRHVLVSGEVISEPRAVSIFAAQQGYISRQFARVGDGIEKGQTLYQIDTSKKTRSGVVSENQRQKITKQINILDDIIRKTEDNKIVTINSLRDQDKNINNLLTRIQSTVEDAEHGLMFMEKNMNNYRSYLTRGLINKDQLINQMATYYQRQNDMLNLRNQESQFELQLINIQTNIKTEEANFDNQINQLRIQKSQTEREMDENDAGGVILVSAPLSGRVESVSVTPGEMVSPGDSLLQILPGKLNRYILVLWVPNDAAPYVSSGDKVNIRYEAFPAEKFGQFPGHVVSISAVPASGQEMSTYSSSPVRSSGPSEVWYKLIVSPDSDGFMYRGKKFSFTNGMKASCMLFLENRKLYQWVFSPLYEIKNNTVGPLNVSE